MADYAAVPVQPIAFALLTIDAAGDPIITGRGFSSVARASASPGDFLLTLSAGTGVADVGSPPGQLLPGVIGPNTLDPRFARVSIQMRSGTTVPGTTTISDRSVTLDAAPGGGFQLRISLAIDPATPTDPMGPGAPNANGGGVEIALWVGNAGAPDSVNVQIFGPAYQPFFKFP